MLNFASDNWTGIAPRIAEGLAAAADGFAPAYGGDPLTAAVTDLFREVFERDLAVFFVSTGSAANALGLASLGRPGGVVFGHRQSHVMVDECGGPEFFASGAKLVPLPGAGGRFSAEALAAGLKGFTPGNVHHGRPVAVSLTQATEAGRVYGLDDIRAIAAVGAGRGLGVHMDGARFANAVAALGATPAEMTWKAGVDILSFGGTKNGCWCADAVVLFDPGAAEEFAYLHKRGAQLFSKARFVAAQFASYLKDGYWLDLAGHANAMARRLADGLAASKSARLAWPADANEVFAIWTRATGARLTEAGIALHEWSFHGEDAGVLGDDEMLVRLVASFATQTDEVDRLLALIDGQ